MQYKMCYKMELQEMDESLKWYCSRCGEFESPPLERGWERSFYSICPTCGKLVSKIEGE